LIRQLMERTRKGNLYNFLHKKGYNYFNIGKLTYGEILLLIDTENKIIKDKTKQMKAANRKAKRR